MTTPRYPRQDLASLNQTPGRQFAEAVEWQRTQGSALDASKLPVVTDAVSKWDPHFDGGSTDIRLRGEFRAINPPIFYPYQPPGVAYGGSRYQSLPPEETQTYTTVDMSGGPARRLLAAPDDGSDPTKRYIKEAVAVGVTTTILNSITSSSSDIANRRKGVTSAIAEFGSCYALRQIDPEQEKKVWLTSLLSAVTYVLLERAQEGEAPKKGGSPYVKEFFEQLVISWGWKLA